jgi:hypothetical protein
VSETKIIKIPIEIKVYKRLEKRAKDQGKTVDQVAEDLLSELFETLIDLRNESEKTK